MSLDFDVTRMKNFNVLTTIVNDPPVAGLPARQWHPVTNALIWATMAIGMNDITEDNWKDFYYRLNMWERSSGPMLWRGNLEHSHKANWITPLEVYMHIGLHTNASKKTEAQFLKDCFKTASEGVKVDTDKVGTEYLDLALDTISEEEFQKAWHWTEDTMPERFDTGALVGRLERPERIEA